MAEVNRFEVRAYFKEYPFLSRYAKDDGSCQIRVQRIDVDLLSKRNGCTREEGDILRNYSVYSRFVLLDKNGVELGWVSFRWRYWAPKSNWLFGSKFVEKPPFPGSLPVLCDLGSSETVGEAIDALQNPERTYYVLRLSESGSIIELDQATIFKPPKAFTLKEWIMGQTEGARSKVQEKIAAIDAEEYGADTVTS